MYKLLIALLLITGCSSAPEPPETINTITSPPDPPQSVRCFFPTEGCPCLKPSQVFDCRVYYTTGTYKSCAIGQTICQDNFLFGPCQTI